MTTIGMELHSSTPGLGRAIILLATFLALRPALIAAEPTPAPSTRFPLAMVDDGTRAYFVDRAGDPFLFTCDIAQALLNRLRIEDVRHYLDVRARQGYSSFWFIIGTPHAMIDDTEFAKSDPRNIYGAKPFANERGDLSAPNRAYFDYVRQVVGEAERRGMLVGIAPAYVGANGGDLLPLMKTAGPAGCRAYGEFIGRFFRDQPNIFWIHHGDQNPYNYGGAETAALVDEFVAGLKHEDNLHPRFHTAISRVIPSKGVPAWKTRTSAYRAQYDDSGERVQPMPWLNLNHVYSKNRAQFTIMLGDLLEAWDVYRTRTNPRLPYITIDGVCTYYHDDARANRVQGYYALLSGAAGFFNGNIRVCWFMSPETAPIAKRNWKEELTSPAEVSASHTARFFRLLPWWKLVPDTGRSLFRDRDHVSAVARTADSRIAVLYLPERRSIEVDLSMLSGAKTQVRWFNPRSGEFHPVETPRQPVAKLIPPAGLEGAAEDWALLLEAKP